jgi:hypothetical protein
MMEAVSTSETWVNFCEITRRKIPEDSPLHTRHRQNLKSHFFLLVKYLVLIVALVPSAVLSVRTQKFFWHIQLGPFQN